MPMVYQDETIRVLLIEDNAELRGTIAAFLSVQPGINAVGSARNVPVALELVPPTGLDVVLLGVQRTLREDIACLRSVMPQAAIIALGFFDDQSRRIVAQANVDAYVDKLNLMNDLPDAIRQAALQPAEAPDSET